MIHQLDIFGKDKVQTAIERFKDFELIDKKVANEGFFIAFSGGKDSVVVKKLADMAGVKYDAHYSLTSVDPPELVRFISEKYPDVSIDKPRFPEDFKIEELRGKQKTMWNLIPLKKIPPTGLARYCCAELKESAGDGRITVTGTRWAESANRKKNQGIATVYSPKKREREILSEADGFSETARGGYILTNDNDENRSVLEYCYQRAKTVFNPIIDWTDEEVWEFIREYEVPYCELYDQGYKRLGCIGCPMSTQQQQQLEKYPKYKQAYKRAFQKMLDNYEDTTNTRWKTADDVYQWWIGEE